MIGYLNQAFQRKQTWANAARQGWKNPFSILNLSAKLSLKLITKSSIIDYISYFAHLGGMHLRTPVNDFTWIRPIRQQQNTQIWEWEIYSQIENLSKTVGAFQILKINTLYTRSCDSGKPGLKFHGFIILRTLVLSCSELLWAGLVTASGFWPKIVLQKVCLSWRQPTWSKELGCLKNLPKWWSVDKR